MMGTKGESMQRCGEVMVLVMMRFEDAGSRGDDDGVLGNQFPIELSPVSAFYGIRSWTLSFSAGQRIS